MKQIILNIKESNYLFFMELINNLDFVEIEDDAGDSKEEIILNLTQAFKDLKDYKEGKLKTTSAKAFIDEL